MSRKTGAMHRHLGKTLLLAAALVAVGALSGGGLVWARGSATEISACVEPRTGYLVYGHSCGGATIVVEPGGSRGTGRVRPALRERQARGAPRGRASNRRRRPRSSSATTLRRVSRRCRASPTSCGWRSSSPASAAVECGPSRPSTTRTSLSPRSRTPSIRSWSRTLTFRPGNTSSSRRPMASRSPTTISDS